MLSLNGLSHIVGVPKNTAATWVEEFNMYVPKTQQQDVMYYLPEAIDVLKFIKKCKYKNYKKPDILKRLANRSFPIRVESTIEDVQMTFEQGNYRENILTVMQTIGMTVSNVANQEKSIQSLQEEQKKRMKIAEQQSKEINDLREQIESLKQAITPANEYEMKKESFARMFE
ncbi:MerR family transcriptional regulator [Virgibacillus salexigens]|uniref:MerR family transcriptional regulator n=1 Tax=Virgibacillus salexigens TaxID=61016 RepID=UPI00190A48A1|nr:MerR family transcriptional regulator [Virgibacillus salexigens]